MKNALLILAVCSLLAPAAGAQQQQKAPEAKKPTMVVTPQGSVRDAPADESEVVKLYDLSVLGASISPPGAAPGASETELMRAMAEAFSLHVNSIGTSLFLVGAMPQDHEKIAALLLQIRQSTAERYRVQLVTMSIPNEKMPEVGVELKMAKGTGTLIDHVVQQRSSATFESLRSQAYIADWQPVVGNDSVGYQPQPKTVSSGVEARVFIAGGDGRTADIRIDGQISQCDIKSVELPLAQGGAKLVIGLPNRDQRSIHADAQVTLGEPTVVSVSTGFEVGSSLVTIVKVEKAQ